MGQTASKRRNHALARRVRPFVVAMWLLAALMILPTYLFPFVAFPFFLRSDDD